METRCLAVEPIRVESSRDSPRIQSMKRIALVLLFLAAALLCYAVGFAAGAVVLIGIGVLFEGAFWITALRPWSPESES